MHGRTTANGLFLVGFLAIPAWTYWRMRSVLWLVIVVAGSIGISGAIISFAHNAGHLFTKVQRQCPLLL